jgi:histidinol-phosphatase (PHP family)
MIVDYHTHTMLCRHADGTLEDYIRQAADIRLDEIGCSDHSPMPEDYDAKHRMTLEQFLREYKPELLRLRDLYSKIINVKFGIEADFFPGTEDWTRNFLSSHEFDYVIGSVHYLGEWGFDNPIFVHKYDERDIDEVYEQYFDHLRKSAESRLFDILGHCDLVKKFGHRPKKNMEEAVREVMKAVKAADMAVEINTSGMRKPVKEFYPSEPILSIIREYGIPIALGSDAHTPSDVARDFNAARGLIQIYSGGKVSVFTRRQRSEVKIG